MKRSPFLIGLSMLSIGLTTGWALSPGLEIATMSGETIHDQYASRQSKHTLTTEEAREAKVRVAAELHNYVTTVVDTAMEKEGSYERAAAVLMQAGLADFTVTATQELRRSTLDKKQRLVEAMYRQIEQELTEIRSVKDAQCQGNATGICSEPNKQITTWNETSKITVERARSFIDQSKSARKLK